MAVADNAASSPRRLASAELRKLWEEGQRGRAVHAILEQWDELMRGGGDVLWIERALRTSGLPAEALAVQVHTARRQGSDVQAWEALVESILQSGDPWWARALLDEAGIRSRALQALRIEVELRLGDASEFIRAWMREHRDDAALDAAVDWWVRSGRVVQAERLVNGTNNLPLWRARFALWRNQPQDAHRFLQGVPPSPQARCLEAIAAVQDGRLEHAEGMLRELLETDAQAEACSWLVTVLRKQGRYGEAVRTADGASIASTTFNVVMRLERELADTYARAAATTSRVGRALQSAGSYFRPLRHFGMRRIGSLEHAPLLYSFGLRAGDRIDALERVLERFGGNHTPYPTMIDQGQLVSCRLPLDPRDFGAAVQLVLFTRGLQAVRSLYRELAPRVNEHPLYRIYEGELELWLGDYEAAGRIFRDVLARERTVRWAWIGLGASAMLQGELRQAQEIWREGLSATRCAGPTLYVYRGECYRRQGETALARRDIEVALRDKPQRLSARINLALLDGTPEALDQASRECAAIAPLLMDELRGSTAEKLEQVLEAMRGNRSSSPWHISYHLWGRIWRRCA